MYPSQNVQNAYIKDVVCIPQSLVASYGNRPCFWAGFSFARPDFLHHICTIAISEKEKTTEFLRW